MEFIQAEIHALEVEFSRLEALKENNTINSLEFNERAAELENLINLLN